MDFIEQILGVMPDDGDGTFELLFFSVLPLTPLVVLFLRRWKRRR